MTGPEPHDVQAAFCAVLCDEWARAGVTDAVVAPGSRSTPLVAALDAEDRIRVHVVLDERSAGFVTLGLSLAARRPAVAVTTSGTASVELHPSVVEAAHAGVPMIVATTDRPPELHQVGAPQTVEQHNLYAGVTTWAVDPGPPDLTIGSSWRSIAARVVDEARRGSGPVHINLPFREPLLGDPLKVDIPPGRPGDRPWHESPQAPVAPPPAELLELLTKHAGGRGLIVAGDGAGPATLDLAAKLGWPVLADPRSGARAPSPYTVAAADALLRVPSLARQTPDIVMRIGSPGASKVVAQWLAGLPAEVPQLLVDTRPGWADPDRRASQLAVTSADAIASALGASVPGSDWLANWMNSEAVAQKTIEGLLKKGGPLDLSEPALARTAVGGTPNGGVVVVSSSMPVRDLEWYAAPRAGVTVLANRGANGIDGVISTAIGAALANGRPTTLLIGDLAFLYDIGSLLWIGSRDVRLSILVADNNGGGIFSFLPQAQAMAAERFERYWGTPHGVDLVALASAYGIEAVAIDRRESLDRFLARGHETGCRVGVVKSDRADNVAVHHRLNSAVADALRV
jgi:2-succinyl-5-enolpyruvyl-6-hydroxy-3-cyclohexene-1-carboxylate synthase